MQPTKINVLLNRWTYIIWIFTWVNSQTEKTAMNAACLRSETNKDLRQFLGLVIILDLFLIIQMSPTLCVSLLKSGYQIQSNLYFVADRMYILILHYICVADRHVYPVGSHVGSGDGLRKEVGVCGSWDVVKCGL